MLPPTPLPGWWALAHVHSPFPLATFGSSFFCPEVSLLGRGQRTHCLSCFCVFLPRSPGQLPPGGPPAGHLATIGFPGTRGWVSRKCCWHHTSVTSPASSALLGEEGWISAWSLPGDHLCWALCLSPCICCSCVLWNLLLPHPPHSPPRYFFFSINFPCSMTM